MRFGLNILIALSLLAVVGCGDSKSTETTTPFLNIPGIGNVGGCSTFSGTPIDPSNPVHSANLFPLYTQPTAQINSISLNITNPGAFYPTQTTIPVQVQGNLNLSDLIPIVFQANVLPSRTSTCVATTTNGTFISYSQNQGNLSVQLSGSVEGTRTVTTYTQSQTYPYMPIPTTTTEPVLIVIRLTLGNVTVQYRPARLIGLATVNVSVQGTSTTQVQNLSARTYQLQ